MFQEMFNNSSFTQQRRRSAPDKMVEVQVSVIESFKGINKTINYAKRNPCDLCDGKGGDRKICTSCNGQGVITKMAGTGFFNQVVRIACEKCQGKGFTLSNVCSKCHGSETNIVMESISISIPKGADDGMFLRLSGKGDYAMGVMGDLVLKVKLIPEQNFEKYGNDLIYNHYFDLKTILEDSFEINHPDGKLSVKVPLDFDSSKSLRIKGKGFVTNTVGDLYVKLNVKFNRELNK
jgi:molecular chaperone DnaJ